MCVCVCVRSPIWQRAPVHPSAQLQVLMSTHLPPFTHGGEHRAANTHLQCTYTQHTAYRGHMTRKNIKKHHMASLKSHKLTGETLRPAVVWGTLAGVWSDATSTVTAWQLTHGWDTHTHHQLCYGVCVCVCEIRSTVTCVTSVARPARRTQTHVPPHAGASVSAGWRTHGWHTHTTINTWNTFTQPSKFRFFERKWYFYLSTMH